MRQFFLYILLLAPFFSFAQIEYDEIGDDIEYLNYKNELELLLNKKASIVVSIAKIKDGSNVVSESDVENIYKLESDLFDLRNKIGVVSAKCSSIEQRYIIKNLTKKRDDGNVKSTNKNNTSTNILLNRFMIENISESEMLIMKSNDNIDFLTLELKDTVRNHYEKIELINRKLRATQDKCVADSLFNLVDISVGVVKRCENELEEAFSKILSTKIEVYSRLLRKLNLSSEEMSKLILRGEEVERMSKEAVNSKFSSIFYSYPLKRNHILEYEKTLSEKLVYLSAIDSINVKMEDVKALASDESTIILPDWSYVNFGSAQIRGEDIHTSVDSVKEVKIPSFGAVYMIYLRTDKERIEAVSELKGVNKVSYYNNHEGEYEYYVGLYPSRDEADIDLPKIKNLGFIASITEWRNGGKVLDKSIIVPIDVFKHEYRIEFKVINDDIVQDIKKVVPTKMISKIGDKYSFGTFNNYLDAINVKKILGEGYEVIAIKDK